MIFLINFDRKTQSVATIERFPDNNRTLAQNRRTELELENFKSMLDREVVLLEAASEAILQNTHRRYFGSIDDIAEWSKSVLRKSPSAA